LRAAARISATDIFFFSSAMPNHSGRQKCVILAGNDPLSSPAREKDCDIFHELAKVLPHQG
jgi:hypothetical protein